MAGSRWLASFEDFKRDVKRRTLPRIALEPRMTTSTKRGSVRICVRSAPSTCLRRGEQLYCRSGEVLRKSDLWEKTLFVITYDEHGGFYDHVAPPEAVAPLKRNESTARRHHRVLTSRAWASEYPPCWSPFIEPATVVHERFDHTSLIATARKLFAPDSEPLNERDRGRYVRHGATRATSRDARKTLRGRVDLPPPPARVGHRPSEHQTSQWRQHTTSIYYCRWNTASSEASASS